MHPRTVFHLVAVPRSRHIGILSLPCWFLVRDRRLLLLLCQQRRRLLPSMTERQPRGQRNGDDADERGADANARFGACGQLGR
jgi:hypothetical protein